VDCASPHDGGKPDLRQVWQVFFANVIIGLIKLTTYLLDRQLRRLEQDFLREGGLRERMTRARLASRYQRNQAT
jgi:four helix bundle suffix protein